MSVQEAENGTDPGVRCFGVLLLIWGRWGCSSNTITRELVKKLGNLESHPRYTQYKSAF